MSKISFESLIDNYGPSVLNTALRILGNDQQAQDVHQEVFLAIWRRWHKYNGQTNWPAYLYRTTVRKAIAIARTKAPTVSLDGIDAPAAGGRPDEQLRMRQLQQKLKTALAKLPSRQADVFVLARIEKLKHEKIAELLGCSPKTVRVHLHRATKRLTKELSDYLDR